MSLLLLLLLPGVGVAEGLSPVQVRFHAFPNGLSLYHVKLDEATTYKLSITVWVGSVDEDREKNGGVSHLLEHILFHQPDMPQTEFKAQITSRGGTHNGETSEHYTRYYVSLPTRHLDLGQRWLHKVLFHDRLTTDRLEQEKEIVNRENEWSSPSWWQQLQNLIDPRYLEVPGFWKRQFGLPEYDQLPEGTYEVASRLTASQLEAHYRAYYYPENMVLLYVGPHELEEVIALVGPTFGSVPPTGREANLSRLLDNEFPRPHLSHELPGFFSRPVYQIGIGHVFTGLRFSQLSGLTLYQSVLQQLLEDRFRYGTGKTYSVWGYWDRHRGAGHLQFNLEAGVDTYWIQLNELKDLVWGDLGEHLSQKEYERYKTTLSEQVASVREPTGVHHLVWGAINQHPLHRPSPNEIDLYGPWRSLSYQDFLDWVRTWRGQTAPLLELSMPAFPFPYANSLAFAFSLGLGAYLTNSLLRRPFPRENIKLTTRVPYGIPGWVHLGLLYAVAASVYFH
ncbi:MAG: M16 family metallopeptidase, partial [Anaerolineae bacterium]